jgi:TP901 family phage tail tape measure protein
LAVKAAMDFDEQITNIASVLLLGRDEADAMGQSMLDMSRNTKFSATELATSMYDVVGGVADASAHMDILAQSAALAEANNAALDGSTNALIATYNAYSAANVEAARVSDVLTATVRDGVGTMDELAAVFGRTSTLASPLGIDIEELGLLFAELSKNGATFSQSGTYIEGALSALINPTKELNDAFGRMGMTQADVLAMLESEGLVAVIQKMVDAGIDLTTVFGNKEALLGVLSIANIDSGRLEEFTTSLEGATEAAREVAATADKFKWDTLVGDFSDLAVVVGGALSPAFAQILSDLSPIVQAFADWASQNPSTIAQIAMLAIGVGGLGVVLSIAGTVISGFGTIAGIAAGAFGLLATAVTGVLSPALLLFGAGMGLIWLFTGEGGIVGGVERALTAIGQLGLIIGVTLMNAISDLINSPLVQSVRRVFETAFNAISDTVNGFIATFETIGMTIQVLASSPVFGTIVGAFQNAFNEVSNIVKGVIDGITGFLGGVQRTIEDVLISLGLMEARSTAAVAFVQSAVDSVNWVVRNAVDQMANQGMINAPTAVPTRKADGGPVFAGQPTIVGERGQEWFVPQTDGMIFNQKQMRGMGGVSIGSLVLNGVQDVQGLYDALMQVQRQRA